MTYNKKRGAGNIVSLQTYIALSSNKIYIHMRISWDMWTCKHTLALSWYTYWARGMLSLSAYASYKYSL